MAASAQQIFERYIWCVMTRNADAAAEMFTDDGVVEAPFVADDAIYPGKVQGREAIRQFITDFHRRTAGAEPKVNIEQSRYVIHTTSDADVFIAEVDVVIDTDSGPVDRPSVYIFRLRDGQIAVLRDYFAPAEVD